MLLHTHEDTYMHRYTLTIHMNLDNFHVKIHEKKKKTRFDLLDLNFFLSFCFDLNKLMISVSVVLQLMV